MGIKTFSSGWEWLFQLLFPGGFSTLKYLAYLTIFGIFLYSITLMIGKNKKESWREILGRIVLAGLVLPIAIFSPILTGMYILTTIWTGFRIFHTYADLPTPRKSLILIVNLGGAIVLLLGGGFISYFWRNLIALYTLIGALLAAIFLSIPRVRVNIFNIKGSFEKSFFGKNKKKIKIKKIALTYLPLLLLPGSLFALTGFVRPYQAPPADYSPSGDMTLKVVTYNIRYGTAGEINKYDNWNERKDDLAYYIDTFNADFILLQEADRFQISYLIRNLEAGTFAYTGAGRDDGVLGGEHSAVVYDKTRFNFLTGGSFWLSGTPFYPQKTWGASSFRICTWGRFEEISTGNQVIVSSVHYDFGTEFREKASKLINERLAEVTGNIPVILGGDFNMNSTMSGYEFLENYGDKPLNNSYHAVHGPGPHLIDSFNRFNLSYDSPTNMIDMIFVSETVMPITCEILQETYTAPDGALHYYSDHFPVVLECIV